MSFEEEFFLFLHVNNMGKEKIQKFSADAGRREVAHRTTFSRHFSNQAMSDRPTRERRAVGVTRGASDALELLRTKGARRAFQADVRRGEAGWPFFFFFCFVLPLLASLTPSHCRIPSCF